MKIPGAWTAIVEYSIGKGKDKKTHKEILINPLYIGLPMNVITMSDLYTDSPFYEYIEKAIPKEMLDLVRANPEYSLDVTEYVRAIFPVGIAKQKILKVKVDKKTGRVGVKIPVDYEKTKTDIE